MAKKQLHIRASDRLQQQLDALTVGGATVTEIVTVAVDRMYREEVTSMESVMVLDLGQAGSIHAAQGGDGKWYLGRFSLKTGQISNGKELARGHSRSAVLSAGYDTPYATLDEARTAAEQM